MSEQVATNRFDVSGKTAFITGGTGILCGAMARELAAQGAKVTVVSTTEEKAARIAGEIRELGGTALGVSANVLDRASIEAAYARAKAEFGPADILINGAGGNRKDATTGPDQAIFDVPIEAVEYVFNLNFIGTFLTTQVVARDMAERGSGIIINISSMSALCPLTKVPAYSAAKAAIDNFTRWLAVHMSQNYSKEIRVNAIAPGFFLTEQNRFLLTDQETGKLTARGETIIAHTPMDRFGDREDLLGTLLYLVSPAAKFVHGVVIPVDGGFSAFGGV